MVTIDDMLVDTLSTEMLKDFVNAVNAIQNSLKRKKRSEFHLNWKTDFDTKINH